MRILCNIRNTLCIARNTLCIICNTLCIARDTLCIICNPPPCQSLTLPRRTRPRSTTSTTRCLQPVLSSARQASRPIPVHASQSVSRGKDASCPCPPRCTVSRAWKYRIWGFKALNSTHDIIHHRRWTLKMCIRKARYFLEESKFPVLLFKSNVL